MTAAKRPGGRSARVRAAVLQATLDELVESGYAALSLDGIARRAGVHKTTLYRRWGTVEGVVLDAMLELGRERVPIPDTGSLRGDLLAYGTAIATSVATPETEAGVRAIASAGQHDARLAAASRRFWAARLELAGAIVERAVARGELPADIDPVVVLEALIAPIYFRLLMTGEPLDAGFVERLAELVTGEAAARSRAPRRAAS